MNNGFQRRNNYRCVDNRRSFQNSQRNGWTDRNRANNEWRSDRDSDKDSKRNKSDVRHPNSTQSTHFPGIPVNRNLSSTPFVSNQTKDETPLPSVELNSEVGSGDHIPQQKVDSLSNKLSEMELKGEESVVSKETEVLTEVSEAIETNVSPKELSPPLDMKTETTTDLKNEIKVVTNNGSNNYVQRRNTIATEYRFQNSRTFGRRNGNQLNGNKSEQNFYPFNPRNQTNDTKKFNNRPMRKYSAKNDLISNYTQQSHYGNSHHGTFNGNLSQWGSPLFTPNICDNYSHNCTHYYPNLYPLPLGYIPPPVIPTNGFEAPNTEPQNNQNESERNTKAQKPTTPSGAADYYNQNAIPYVNFFERFRPTVEHPEPPMYYGNLLAIPSAEGMVYYFQSPNMAPLLLEIDAISGKPILPSNCYYYNYIVLNQ